jgi:DNA adenine methylase
LYNLAQVVAHRYQCCELYKRLRHVLVSERFLDQAREKLKEPYTTGVERAYWFFINSWLGRNGMAGTHLYNQTFCRRFTSRGGSPSIRFTTAINSIPAWRRRLQRVTILNMDAFELIGKVEDQAGMAIYVDPPYMKDKRDYVHDFKAADHEFLAAALRRFSNARIVVSYYEHPKLDELYPNWYRQSFRVTKVISHVGQRGKNDKRAIEVLLSNQPLPEETAEPSLFGE